MDFGEGMDCICEVWWCSGVFPAVGWHYCHEVGGAELRSALASGLLGVRGRFAPRLRQALQWGCLGGGLSGLGGVSLDTLL